MRKPTLKATAFTLFLTLLISAVFILPVSAAGGVTPSGIEYAQSGTSAVITGYSGSAKEVIIPEKIGGLTVTEIGKEAFKGSTLEYISIPKTVDKIGADAFLDVYTLKTVDIEDVGAWCETDFANEYSNPAISVYAKLCIDGAEIKSLYIPDDTAKISAFAFYGNNSIEAVFIPQSVKSIGEMAFRGANKIKDVYCVSTGADWEAMTSKAPTFLRDDADVWLINPKETAMHGLKYREENGKIVITGYEGNLYKLAIPAEIDGKPVAKIDSYAFSGLNTLAEVIIPDTVTDIFPGAFNKCKYLVSVKLPKGLKTLHEEVFGYCESLQSIEIPKGVTEIVYFAFRDCYSFTRVVVPEGVKTLGEHAFGNCKNLKEVSLPDSITDISGAAFYDTALYKDENNWADGVFYVDGYLIKVSEDVSGKYTVKEGTRVIPDGAFSECSELTEVVLPDSVVKIGSSAFYKCEKLKSINIPEGVTEIPYNAFNWCSSLEKVVLPSTVTAIGDGAFGWCKSLKEINIPEGVTKISSSAFELCAFESITLPESVTVIETNAFRNCPNLTEVKLGSNVTSITYMAFSGTPLSENRENWEDNALYLGNCLLAYSDLKATTYTVKDGTKTIGFDAFKDSYYLEEINVPESVENLGKAVFSGPFELKVINFGGSELQWNRMVSETEGGIGRDVTVNFAKESEYILGDVTLDGRLNVRDATLIQKHMAKMEVLEEKALELADFNNDGKVNVKDATAIQKHIAGIAY